MLSHKMQIFFSKRLNNILFTDHIFLVPFSPCEKSCWEHRCTDMSSRHYFQFYSGGGLLDLRVTLCLTFSEITMLISQSCQQNTRSCIFFFTSSVVLVLFCLFAVLLIVVILLDLKWSFIIALVFISLQSLALNNIPCAYWPFGYLLWKDVY